MCVCCGQLIGHLFAMLRGEGRIRAMWLWGICGKHFSKDPGGKGERGGGAEWLERRGGWLAMPAVPRTPSFSPPFECNDVLYAAGSYGGGSVTF